MPKHTAKPLTAAAHAAPTTTDRIMNTQLLSYYEAIEQASADMLSAARSGNWDEVVKLEGACVLLISQLKHAASQQQLARTRPSSRRASCSASW
ncbi:flagellar protein fliT domain-containing protein [Ditylenchus destructor]|nr:flagellar protein fliT domain-containing protein [Ditylenchus destructor]